jgi:uncharacterized membrane protein
LALLAMGGCRPARSGGSPPAALYAQARAVVDRHCLGCHADRPTNPAFPIAPKGIELDTEAQMRQHARKIRERAVVDRTMPLLNKTGMIDEERQALARWIEAAVDDS